MTTYNQTLSVIANVGGAMTQQGWGDQEWGTAFGGVSGYPALLLKNSFLRTLIATAAAVITPTRNSIYSKVLTAVGTGVTTLIRQTQMTLAVTSIASLITRKTVKHIFGSVTVTGTAALVKLPVKLLTVTSAGIATVTKLPGKLLSVVAEPAISIAKGLQFFRTLYVAVVSASTVNKHMQVALSAIGEGIATLTKFPDKLMYVQASVIFWMQLPPIWLRMMVVTVTAVPAMDRLSSFYLTMTVRVQGVSDVFKFHARDLAVQITAVADLITHRVYDRTIAVIAEWSATVTKLPDKLMSVTVTGIPSFTRRMYVDLTVVAQGAVSLTRKFWIRIAVVVPGIATRSLYSAHYRMLQVTVPVSVAITKHMHVLLSVIATGIARPYKTVCISLSVIAEGCVTRGRVVVKLMIVVGNVVVTRIRKWGIISVIRSALKGESE